MADDEDIVEDSYWGCTVCGAGGPCVKGDEATARAIHQTVCPGKPPGK